MSAGVLIGGGIGGGSDNAKSSFFRRYMYMYPNRRELGDALLQQVQRVSGFWVIDGFIGHAWVVVNVIREYYWIGQEP